MKKTIKRVQETAVALVSLLSAVTFSSGMMVSADTYFKGSGTAEDPYQIATKEDLFEMSELVNDDATAETYNRCYYVQTADIDLENDTFMPIGTRTGANTGTGFLGHYNGNYYDITGLNVSRVESNYSGLFGWIYESGSIENLVVQGNIKCVNSVNVGGIVGEMGFEASIRNCAFIGTVEAGTGVGGVVGHSWCGGTIQNCYFNGDIIATSQQAGSIISGGMMSDDCTTALVVENCYAAGSINYSNAISIGGLIGYIGESVTSDKLRIQNNYYLSTMHSGAVNSASYAGCMNLSEKALKASADMLGTPFCDNTDETLNSGYPVFEWQIVPDAFTGSGTLKDPYQISSAADLWEMARLINSPYFADDFRYASYIQTNNIDLNDEKWTPIGSDGYDAPFEGTYDGNQHFITGLNVYDEEHYNGLFATISGESIVQNLVVYGNVRSTGNYTGGIIGEIGYGASATNCAFIGTVSGVLNTGGIAGKVWDSGAIFDCYSYGEIFGTENSGGIVGMIHCVNGNGTAMLKNCYHVGAVTDEREKAGGIVGYVEYDEATGNVVTLKNSYYLKDSAEEGFYGAAVIEDCTGIPENLFKMLAADLGDSYITNPNSNFLEGYPCFVWQTYGDINADQTISVVDVVALQKHLLSIKSFTQGELCVADVNQDTKVNVFDLCLLKRTALEADDK